MVCEEDDEMRGAEHARRTYAISVSPVVYRESRRAATHDAVTELGRHLSFSSASESVSYVRFFFFNFYLNDENVTFEYDGDRVCTVWRKSHASLARLHHSPGKTARERNSRRDVADDAGCHMYAQSRRHEAFGVVRCMSI